VDNVNRPQLKEAAFWKRALYMILFAIAYSIAELIVAVIVIVQFLTILFTGRANETLLQFGNSLSAYVWQILRFVMYNTEHMPFPFSDWPLEPVDGDRWRVGAGAVVVRDEPVSESGPGGETR